ncbi:phage holin family protein [Leifsonia virtsii]|uniref:Phage holin family protein n=1 Tax=Leifsonia virtsii TaxID=3035915 RepID=A0ABT8IYR3_9MICO|nr:phage holin family protein [Leifsonia virtsii]MDN4597964.1 phage holin family protein [Leifsonia virtsii]
MRFLLRLIINALALWLTTLIVSGVTVHPYASGTVATVLTYLLIALIFGVVNAVIGTVIRIVAIPLYILTLGLISLLVNAFLLFIVSWISDAIGFGLHIDGFWAGVLGALVLGIIAWLLGLIFRPARRG